MTMTAIATTARALPTTISTRLRWRGGACSWLGSLCLPADADAGCRAALFHLAALGTKPEQLHGMVHPGESGLGRDLLGPPLHRAALDLDTGSAVAADEVMVVGVALAPPVQRLAAGVPDRVDQPVFAKHLQVPVDGGQ